MRVLPSRNSGSPRLLDRFLDPLISASSTSEYGNAEAESLVFRRFLAFYLLVVPVPGLLLGDGLYSSLKGRPLLLGFEFLLVAGAAIGVLALVLGYLSATMVVRSGVPRTVTIDQRGIVGDFRRKGWTGLPELEILFSDVRAMRRTRVLRLPIVRGHRDVTRKKPIPDAVLFYLTQDNLDRVRKAIQAGTVPVPKD